MAGTGFPESPANSDSEDTEGYGNVLVRRLWLAGWRRVKEGKSDLQVGLKVVM